MNIDLVIASGYDTPDLLAGFLMLDTEEQDEIYRASVGKLQNKYCDCALPEKPNHTPRKENAMTASTSPALATLDRAAAE